MKQQAQQSSASRGQVAYDQTANVDVRSQGATPAFSLDQNPQRG